MTQREIEQAIREELARLPPASRQAVLAYAQSLGISHSVASSPSNLARFAGSIDAADLDAMDAAIDAACEQVDLDES